MLRDELQAVGLTDEVRKELVEYYKWIVNLATFVLTVSISLVGLFAQGMSYKALLVLGWVLLGLCIFLNWLLVKRLVTIPIVDAVAPEDAGWHHRLFKATIGNMKAYGLVQNWAFLLGVLFVCAAFALNLGRA
jgi:hypothetical protein